MRRSIPSFLGVLFACGLAVPAAAQDGNLSLAFFMTVDDANVPQLEEGIRRHNSWHQRQGDTWNLSGPEGATHFVVVPASSFAEFDIEGPEPPEILAQAYGMTEARNILEMFSGAMTFTASRIWVLRPDLSNTPN